MSIFESYKKEKNLLVCVDSDGCVMDTMNCKHFHCFGPRMVDEWNLHQWKDEILKRWNEINLYQMTRGINRFAGLAMALSEINEKYTRIDGVEALSLWVKTTRALSNGAIKETAESLPKGDERTCLEKALSWSNAVNKSIINLPSELKIPFSGAKEGLTAAEEEDTHAHIVKLLHLSAYLLIGMNYSGNVVDGAMLAMQIALVCNDDRAENGGFFLKQNSLRTKRGKV